ncbi:MAG TPA: ceramide glucosyltransferase [Elusimicrobia bacterium]|nr:ceramide glucosyltransferase [Elusimicrobiota bacterium]HBT62746.1 ceramide glucosyltransferase [Elusimicrobiota bacterium]
MDWQVALLFLLTAYAVGKAILTWAAYATAAFSVVFALACIPAAFRLLRRRLRPPEELPPVTILKPLKGADRRLYDNLASFCRQDYPRFQVLFAVASCDDEALPVVDRLRRELPDRDIQVVISNGRIGCNPKINNISNAYPLARHGILLLSDSDICVPPDFLRRSVAPLSDPRVGLVTCFYRCAEARGLWGSLEALSVNAHFLLQAVLAGALGMRFAMGAAILVRRRVFDRIGGFGALADHLADDFALGAAVERAGYRIEFSDVVVESVPPEDEGLADMFRHQVRWQRTVRLCNPAGYCGSFLLHGFSLAALALLFFGWNGRLAALAAVLLAAKALAALTVQFLSGAPPRLSALALLPLSEWLAFGAWLSGFGLSSVLWRGQTYALLPDGRLIPADPAGTDFREPLEPAAPVAAKT